MNKQQNDLLTKLIEYCTLKKYTVLNYNIGGGVKDIPDTSKVIDEDGGVYSLYYDDKCRWYKSVDSNSKKNDILWR